MTAKLSFKEQVCLAINAQGLGLSDKSLIECVRKIAASNDESQAIITAAQKLVRCKGRFHAEQNYRALAALFGITVPTVDPWILVSDRKPPMIEGSVGDAVQYLLEWDDGKIDAGFWLWSGHFQRANGTSEGMIDWDGKEHYVVAWMDLPRREVGDEARA